MSKIDIDRDCSTNSQHARRLYATNSHFADLIELHLKWLQVFGRGLILARVSEDLYSWKCFQPFRLFHLLSFCLQIKTVWKTNTIGTINFFVWTSNSHFTFKASRLLICNVTLDQRLLIKVEQHKGLIETLSRAVIILNSKYSCPSSLLHGYRVLTETSVMNPSCWSD